MKCYVKSFDIKKSVHYNWLILMSWRAYAERYFMENKDTVFLTAIEKELIKVYLRQAMRDNRTSLREYDDADIELQKAAAADVEMENNVLKGIIARLGG